MHHMLDTFWVRLEGQTHHFNLFLCNVAMCLNHPHLCLRQKGGYIMSKIAFSTVTLYLG